LARCGELFGDDGTNYLVCELTAGTVDGRGGDDTLETDNGSVDGGSGIDRYRGATTVNCEEVPRLAALPRKVRVDA